MTKILLLKNGLIYSDGRVMPRDVLIEDGVIKNVANGIEDENAKEVNLTGKIISPGFLDIHCHIRTPGQEYKEDIKSATRAAVKGGYTGIVAMANTSPVIDSIEQVLSLKERIKGQAECDVHVIGAVTMGLEGKELTNYDEMYKEVVAFSDDGVGIQDENIMEKALKKCHKLGRLIVSHCEYDLEEKGVINKGKYSEELNLHGIDNATEWAMVKRDLKLAEKLNARVHIAHVSTKESVELIKEAKLKGIKVTAEACPHHFLLTDSEVNNLKSIAKVNPPLRDEEDRVAVLQGIVDGVIDCIATDHAPHSFEEKQLSLNEAPFGMVGLETTANLCLNLVNKGLLTVERLIEALGVIPYKVMGIEGGIIAPGERANLTILDINQSYRINKELFHSKGKNTPFNGFEGKGTISMTIVNGEIKYRQGGDETCL